MAFAQSVAFGKYCIVFTISELFNHVFDWLITIRDAIKQNESELENIDLKILQSLQMLYLANQLPNLHGVFTKLNLK